MNNRKLIIAFIRPIGIAALLVAIGGSFVCQPTFRRNSLSTAAVNPQELRAHVIKLSQDLHPRSWLHTNNLNACADYISGHFIAAGAAVEPQFFQAREREYRNVIGRFGQGRGSRIIVGAHYDSCGDTPGADDNASGVAVLIELAHLLGRYPPEREVELVAYSLEEPPFFDSDLMGSVVHARGAAEQKSDLTGVIVLEMVGYFSDEPRSQRLPFPLLRLFYPDRGNFVALIGQWDQGGWIRKVKAGMKGATTLPVYSLRAPVSVTEVDYSDHMNYWPHGIHAIMVTDTAFYRNTEYHSLNDTADRLDYHRTAQVTVAVFEALRFLR